MITTLKSVNFGESKTGLATIGYALYNLDGSLAQARITAGISELLAGSGIYKCQMSFADHFQGMIIWDTGESTPLYAAEDFDYLTYIGKAGGGYSSVIVDNVWTKEEKDDLIKTLAKIMKVLRIVPEVNKNMEDLTTSNKNVSDSVALLHKSQPIKSILERMTIDNAALSADIKNLLEKMELISKSTTQAITKDMSARDMQEMKILETLHGLLDQEDDIQKIRECVNNLNKEIASVLRDENLIIRIMSKLVTQDDLETILKEGGINVPRDPFEGVGK